MIFKTYQENMGDNPIIKRLKLGSKISLCNFDLIPHIYIYGNRNVWMNRCTIRAINSHEIGRRSLKREGSPSKPCKVGSANNNKYQ